MNDDSMIAATTSGRRTGALDGAVVGLLIAASSGMARKWRPEPPSNRNSVTLWIYRGNHVIIGLGFGSSPSSAPSPERGLRVRKGLSHRRALLASSARRASIYR
jgi:hypothetical protein